ncbi:MAG TPA: ElyC/SanA/YdcF family protein [Flavobacteriales bacterium]|nr:ElyC/SanA/YdcF family protein [Flavobacteriales bacterium]
MGRSIRWRVLRWSLLVGLPVVLGILIGEWRIAHYASDRLYSDVDRIPGSPVGLLLGTSARGGNGNPNPYFTSRIDAAVALYKAGKVEHLLLTGDNGRWSYNEPMDMRSALMAAGVDSTDITLDFAGFDTFDSVVRARKIFGQRRLTIISQRSHDQRALWIARSFGIDAIGFSAGNIATGPTQWSWIRERGARLKMWWDLALGLDPHFLGDPVTLGEQELH